MRRAGPAVPRTVHVIVGHFNPRCARCGRTVMAIQNDPLVACEQSTLPFEKEARADGHVKALGID